MIRDKALMICGISKHKYYHGAKVGKRGRKPTETSLQISETGELLEVDNGQVLDDILIIKSDPETDYGYRAMTKAIMLLGYIINHKKVYRLMKEYLLLHDLPAKAKRNYVKYKMVLPDKPLTVFEMDIKFQWVAEHGRHAYILSVIDCFTRKVLYWTVGYSIKHMQVKKAWESIIVNYLQPHDLLGQGVIVQLRNDNDKRFAANEIQKYFKDNSIDQVFTHPYTPEENGHIESFHSILSRSLERKDFTTIHDLEKHLKRFYEVYNTVRLHGSLDHLSPDMFWKLWEMDMIDRIVKKNNKVVFQLKVPHYFLSGNGNLREVSSSLAERFKEELGAKSLHLLPSVQRSPSVVSSPVNLVP